MPFSVIRRFRTLNIRVLLKRQDEICQLEEELAVLEKENISADDPAVDNGSFRCDRLFLFTFFWSSIGHCRHSVGLRFLLLLSTYHLCLINKLSSSCCILSELPTSLSE
jgi:hypothetical protein